MLECCATLRRRDVRAGAAGSFALQFAHAAGAHVTATVGSERKAELARALGADEVVQHRECGDLSEALARACPDGFQVAMDGVGGEMQDAILANLAPGSRVLLTGYISEYPHTQRGALLTASQGCAVPPHPASQVVRVVMWRRVHYRAMVVLACARSHSSPPFVLQATIRAPGRARGMRTCSGARKTSILGTASS